MLIGELWLSTFFILQVELASLQFPYSKWLTPFDQLHAVVNEPSPRLPLDFNYTECFHVFVDLWYLYSFNFKDITACLFSLSVNTSSLFFAVVVV